MSQNKSHVARFLVLPALMIPLLLQGCNTARGFKQDVKSVVSKEEREDTWLFKADRWLQEHLW